MCLGLEKTRKEPNVPWLWEKEKRTKCVMVLACRGEK